MKNPLEEKIYADEVFSLPHGQRELFPTFEDQIDFRVPRGIYSVEVGIYDLPPGVRVADLADPKVANRHLLKLGAREVSIGD